MLRSLLTRMSTRSSQQGLGYVKSYSSETSVYAAPPRGTNAAYDAALDYLQEYSNTKINQAKEVEKALESTQDEAVKKELKDEIFKTLVDSKLYQPATKWQFENNKYDSTEPVFMHLKQKKWKEEESPRVEQRVTQMFVLPDVLPPGLVLDAKVSVIYGDEEAVFPGTKIDPALTIKKPKVFIDCFHKELKKYTIIMVDPDHPVPEIKNYKEKIHWAMCDISANVSSSDPVSGEELIDYVPPHPAQGTKFHRYTFVLLEQPDGFTSSSIKKVLEDPNTTIRSLVETLGLIPRGLHFFRAEWSTAVSAIYTDTFGILEPIFGVQPEVDPKIGPDGRIRNKYHNV